MLRSSKRFLWYVIKVVMLWVKRWREISLREKEGRVSTLTNLATPNDTENL